MRVVITISHNLPTPSAREFRIIFCGLSIIYHRLGLEVGLWTDWTGGTFESDKVVQVGQSRTGWWLVPGTGWTGWTCPTLSDSKSNLSDLKSSLVQPCPTCPTALNESDPFNMAQCLTCRPACPACPKIILYVRDLAPIVLLAFKASSHF
jgi:hypothetical protein